MGLKDRQWRELKQRAFGAERRLGSPGDDDRSRTRSAFGQARATELRADAMREISDEVGAAMRSRPSSVNLSRDA